MSCQLTPAAAVPRCFRTDIIVCRADGVRFANQDIMPSMMLWLATSVVRTLRSIGIPAILEPPGLLRLDGKKPEGITLIPWSGCCSMLWDFTYPNTRTPSHLPRTTFTVGATASSAKSCKIIKYSDLSHCNDGCLGVGCNGPSFSVRSSPICGFDSRDPRSALFLKQRIDIATERQCTIGSYYVCVGGYCSWSFFDTSYMLWLGFLFSNQPD